jgi:hypothetical protein
MEKIAEDRKMLSKGSGGAIENASAILRWLVNESVALSPAARLEALR